MTRNCEKATIERLVQNIAILEERLLALELRAGILPKSSPGRVKERILTAYPQIANTDLPDFTRTCMIREWVYRNTLEQYDLQTTFDQDPRFAFYKLSVDDIFSAFDHNVGGVVCGGIGWVLCVIYRLFGFKTYILDCGLSEKSATHISNVVQLRHNDSWRWVIQDAYFNCSYLCANGEPLDLFTMLGLLTAREHRSITISAGDANATRRMIVGPASQSSFQEDWRSERAGPPSECADGRLLFNIKPTIDSLVSSKCKQKGQQYFDLFFSFNLPADLIYLYVMIFAVYPESEPGAVELKRLIANELLGAEFRG